MAQPPTRTRSQYTRSSKSACSPVIALWVWGWKVSQANCYRLPPPPSIGPQPLPPEFTNIQVCGCFQEWLLRTDTAEEKVQQWLHQGSNKGRSDEALCLNRTRCHGDESQCLRFSVRTSMHIWPLQLPCKTILQQQSLSRWLTQANSISTCHCPYSASLVVGWAKHSQLPRPLSLSKGPRSHGRKSLYFSCASWRQPWKNMQKTFQLTFISLF